jgi:thiamine pyrophosphate-dependent acetolactate synthase large subunit-like protein
MSLGQAPGRSAPAGDAMTNDEYFETLQAHWQGQLVVCALGTSANEWWRRTRSTACFYMHAAMGFTSSFALGLALSLPGEEIWLLNSDGGLAMNLGGLLTEASLQPGNLKHFVLSNRCYQTLRGAPLVNAERTDYVAVARGAGIANVQGVEEAAELATLLPTLAGTGRHALVIAEVAPMREAAGFEPPPPQPYEGPELKYRFGRHIEAKLGITVFGPAGF